MFIRYFYRLRQRLVVIARWREHVPIWFGAIAVGCVVAAFARIGLFADAFYNQLFSSYPLLAFVLTPLVFVTTTWLTKHFFAGAEGSGVPQTMATLYITNESIRSRLLSLRLAFGKIFLTLGALFGGASVGCEGPSVHIGASIMHAMRKFGALREHDMTQLLIVAGGAAGIAAAFNTPLAGVLFAIEQLSRSFNDRSTGTVLFAVILAGVVALALLGHPTYFGTSPAHILLNDAWAAIALCGIVGGVLGGLFSSSLIWTSRRVAPVLRHYPLRTAFVCGLGLSMLGWLSDGDVNGTGYSVAKELVTNGSDVGLLYPLLKIIATVLSYLSGIPGGLFAPSLSIGAGLGADLAHWLPSVPVTAMVLFGTVAYFTGVAQTPLTALVMVTEMTGNASMMLPLMMTALLAKVASIVVCPRPLYLALAEPYLPDRRLNPRPAKTNETSSTLP